MKINLKKARKLEAKIYATIQGEKIETEERVRINAAITDIELKLLSGKKRVLEEIKNKQSLIELRYKIRRLIAEANEQSGVSSLINDKVMLEQQKTLLNTYISDCVGYTSEELGDVIDQEVKEMNKEGSFMRSKSALTNLAVLMEEDMEQFKDGRLAIIKKIEDIDDKLAELNYTTKIEIEKDDIDLLTLNKLI